MLHPHVDAPQGGIGGGGCAAHYVSEQKARRPTSFAKVAALPKFAKHKIRPWDIQRKLTNPARKIQSSRGAPRKLSQSQKEELRQAMMAKNNGDGISKTDVMAMVKQRFDVDIKVDLAQALIYELLPHKKMGKPTIGLDPKIVEEGAVRSFYDAYAQLSKEIPFYNHSTLTRPLSWASQASSKK